MQLSISPWVSQRLLLSCVWPLYHLLLICHIPTIVRESITSSWTFLSLSSRCRSVGHVTREYLSTDQNKNSEGKVSLTWISPHNEFCGAFLLHYSKVFFVDKLIKKFYIDKITPTWQKTKWQFTFKYIQGQRSFGFTFYYWKLSNF